MLHEFADLRPSSLSHRTIRLSWPLIVLANDNKKQRPSTIQARSIKQQYHYDQQTGSVTAQDLGTRASEMSCTEMVTTESVTGRSVSHSLPPQTRPGSLAPALRHGFIERGNVLDCCDPRPFVDEMIVRDPIHNIMTFTEYMPPACLQPIFLGRRSEWSSSLSPTTTEAKFIPHLPHVFVSL